MAPIKTFQVENVQSIKDLTLTFDKSGVFYISGGNNIGKSALTQVLAVHFNNISNNQYKEMLRDGTDYFKTTLIDYDGNWTTLSRGAVDYYEWSINGETGRLDKTQGKVPAVLKEYFNLYEDAYDKENLNIRNETSPILFSRTPGTANFRYLQEALGVDAYHKGAKEASKKQREQKTLEKAYVEAVDSDQGELELREGKLASVQSDYQLLNTMTGVLDSKVDNLTLLSQLIDLLRDIQQNERLTSSVGTFIQMDLDELRDKLDTLMLLDKCLKLAYEINDLVKVTRQLKPLQDLNTDNLTGALDQLSLLTKLTVAVKEQRHADQVVTLLQPLADLELDGYDNQFQTLEQVTKTATIYNQVKELHQTEVKLQEAVAQKEADEEAFLDQFDICPFCQQPMEHHHHNQQMEGVV